MDGGDSHRQGRQLLATGPAAGLGPGPTVRWDSEWQCAYARDARAWKRPCLP